MPNVCSMVFLIIVLAGDYNYKKVFTQLSIAKA